MCTHEELTSVPLASTARTQIFMRTESLICLHLYLIQDQGLPTVHSWSTMIKAHRSPNTEMDFSWELNSPEPVGESKGALPGLDDVCTIC